MKKFTVFLLDVFIILSILFAVIGDITAFKNVVYFYNGLIVLGTITMYQAKYKNRERMFSWLFNNLFWFTAVVTFVMFGWWFSGVLWFISYCGDSRYFDLPLKDETPVL